MQERELFEAEPVAWQEYAQHLEWCRTCAEDGMDSCHEGAQLKEAAVAAPQHSTAEPERVYIVATGELYEGQETYTRHANRPPPLCDAELLFAAPHQAPDHAALPAEVEALRKENASLRKASQAVVDRWDSPQWKWIKQGPTADVINDLRTALRAKEESRG